MNNSDQVTWGHPRGLYYLFFAELWERFSFYGMRALLVLYMTKRLLFEDEKAFGVFAAYMSLVYFTPIIGGILADKYLGFRKAIMWGGILMAFGHFFLTIEQPLFFYGSLALVIVGNGLFKPNISSFVGQLYEDNDVRRDSGFTIFYMGINIGGAVAPLLCAYLAVKFGWHYGFVLAGIGMLLGLFFFDRGLKNNVFGNKGKPTDSNLSKKVFSFITKEQLLFIPVLLSVPLFALIVVFNQYEHYMVWVTSIIIIIFLIKIGLESEKEYRGKLFIVAYFTILMSVFWAIFEQAGSSLTLFADRNVNLIGMNAAQTNSINSTFIILFAIPFSMMWSKLTTINRNPNSIVKFGIGLLLLGLGFVVFGSSSQLVDGNARTPMLFLIIGYMILTIGELFISPIGLSKMTELSPPKYIAFIMGVFFTSSFFGHFFAGKIAKLTTVNADQNPLFSNGILGEISTFITGLDFNELQSSKDSFLQLYSYVSVYSNFGIISMTLGLFVIVSSFILKPLMHEIN